MGPYKTPPLLSGAGVDGENGLLDFPNSTLASASVCLRMLSSFHHIDEGYSFGGAGYFPKQSVYPHCGGNPISSYMAASRRPTLRLDHKTHCVLLRVLFKLPYHHV